METNEERNRRIDRQIEQNTQAIAQLITLGRAGIQQAELLRDSVHEAVTRMEAGIEALGKKLDGYATAAEARSKELDDRMNMLINIFDDFIRRSDTGKQ